MRDAQVVASCMFFSLALDQMEQVLTLHQLPGDLDAADVGMTGASRKVHSPCSYELYLYWSSSVPAQVNSLFMTYAKEESFHTMAVGVSATFLHLLASACWILTPSWRMIWCTWSGLSVKDKYLSCFNIWMPFWRWWPYRSTIRHLSFTTFQLPCFSNSASMAGAPGFGSLTKKTVSMASPEFYPYTRIDWASSLQFFSWILWWEHVGSTVRYS